MQTYNTLAASKLENDLGPVSGGISLFAARMLKLRPENRGDFFDLAVSMSDEMLGGEVSMEPTGDYTMPRIGHRVGELSLPLHRSSSTVNEIAPLVLFLKHRVREGHVLIIEEPEAHLHPANIRVLAKYFVRLARRGVKLIITTHSDYLLEQLDAFVMLGSVEPDERERRFGYGADDYLSASELGVYFFKRRADEMAFDAEALEVDPTRGTLSGDNKDEFAGVMGSLYDELTELRSTLREKD